MVEWLFLAVTWVCLKFVIVVFPDHTHLLFLFSNFKVRGGRQNSYLKQAKLGTFEYSRVNQADCCLNCEKN